MPVPKYVEYSASKRKFFFIAEFEHERNRFEDISVLRRWPHLAKCKIKSESLQTRFKTLAEQWKAEVSFLPSTLDMVLLPSYQKIIGMGWGAVPYILKELQEQPHHWFWALKAITGVDPTSPEDAGRVSEQADAWIAWGYKKGILG